MIKLFEIIGDANYSFLGPLTFTFILVFGIIMGFWLGLKSASLFYVFNLVSFALIILMFNYISHIVENTNVGSIKIKGHKINEITNNDIHEVFQKNTSLNRKASIVGINNFVAIFASLIIYAVLNIFVFLPLYMILRHVFKSNIKKNVKLGKNNLMIRLGGAGFGLISIAPLAIIGANLFAAFGDADNAFSDFINQITKLIFFGKIKNIPTSLRDMSYLVKLL